MKYKDRILLVVLALLLAIVLAACSSSGDNENSGASEENTSSEPAESNENSNAGESSEASEATTGSETITLIENPWPASELNAAVAKIIIENEFGNPVEVVALDENASWDALAGGEADANLEVWPSGHSERIAEYIDNLGTVENGGDLGPVGVIGWYVPTYVIEEHPDLATWEGYKDPANAALFATAETGDKGRFVAADPSWVQYDEAIISNLELPFEVVWTGSEEALLAEVSSAYSRHEPVLFYFYTPHAIFQRFDLTQVQLPPYSDECYADPAAIACEYPPDQLLKAISAQLAEKDPTVYQFLKNFNYGSSDPQISMLAALDEGLSVEEAAQQWIDNNESIWRTWLS